MCLFLRLSLPLLLLSLVGCQADFADLRPVDRRVQDGSLVEDASLDGGVGIDR